MNSQEKILTAADRLFGKIGFDAASTREIAELSGVNKALIHYHFKNKEDLLASVLDRYYVRLNETLLKALQSDSSVHDRLGAMIDAYVDFLAKNINFARILQRESAGGRHTDLIRRHVTPMFEMGMKLVESAYPAASGGGLEARQLLISFSGMILSYFTYSGVLKHVWDTDPLSRQALENRKRHLRRMLNIVEKALAEEQREQKIN